MKQIHWSKLPPGKIDKTVFKTANDDKVYKAVKIESFESLFGKVVEVPKEEETVDKDKPANKKVALLDGKRSNNISITLSRFNKVSNAELRAAILSLSEDSIPLDALPSLLKIVPTPEELEALKEYDGDLSLLGKAEVFLSEVGTIPLFGTRLSCWLYKRKFNISVSEIMPDIQSVIKACNAVNNCKNLIGVMEIILALGNYMNGSTAKGGAFGFKLDILEKLGDVKSNDNTVTLLHYIANVVGSTKEYKDYARFVEELAVIDPAIRIDMKNAAQDAQALITGLGAVDAGLKQWAALKDHTKDDKFGDVMTSFMKSAQRDIDNLKESIASMDASYKSVVELFGESTSMTNDKFFGTLSTFASQFKKAMKENEERAKPVPVVEHVPSDIKTPVKAAGPTVPSGVDRGEMDSMINDIKEGRALALKRRVRTPTLKKKTEAGNNTNAALLAATAKTSKIVSSDKI